MFTLLLLVIFALGTAAMITRTLPALLALPAMAMALAAAAAWQVAPALGGGAEALAAFHAVLTEGAVRLDEAMLVAILGGVLSHILQSSGVAENLIKHGAELAGDRPIGVSVATMVLVALLFTSVGGLGALIMVAMIVLPVLSTVGVQPAAAGGILLFGMSLGGLMNAGNWVLYTQTLQVPAADVHRFALSMAGLVFAAGVVFIILQLRRDRVLRIGRGAVAWIAASLAVAGLVFVIAGGDDGPDAADASDGLGVTGLVTLISLGAAVLHALVDGVRRLRDPSVPLRVYAYLIPFVPLALILVFAVPILPAFVIGLLYAALATLRPGSRNAMVRSLLEGSAAVLPAALLMVGIGLLVTAIMGPATVKAAGVAWPVTGAMEPLVRGVDLTARGAYVLAFGLLAPLALYRGPLNVWGMGFGVASVLMSAGMPGPAIMAMMLSVGQVQGICDPTNTVNVWLANELRVDVLTLTRRTLPVVWALVFVGLLLAAARYL